MTLLFGAPVSVQLKEQLGLLRDLLQLYDSGAYRHALSIAARASVIVEILRSSEGGKHIRDAGVTFSTPINPVASGEKQVAPLVSKKVYVDDNMVVVAQVNSPIFMENPVPELYRCNLGRWLSQPAFYYARDGHVSREQLLKMMRNVDGGGHPYSLVPAEYLQFASGEGALSINVSSVAALEPTPPLHLASMRQIGHELMEALKDVV